MPLTEILGGLAANLRHLGTRQTNKGGKAFELHPTLL